MPFLYYLPGLTYAEITAEALIARGLERVLFDLLARAEVASQLVVRQVHGAGPDQASGVIVCAPGEGEAADNVGYYPARQTWLPPPPGSQPGCWLGWEALPGPAALSRPTAWRLEGYPTPLGDRQEWEVPVVRQGGRAPALPRRMALSPAGEFALEVLPEFDWAWQASGRIFDHVFGAPALRWSEAFALCCDVLSLNYRLGPREVSALGLVTTQNFQAIFEAAIDWPQIQALLAPAQKKTGSAPAGSPNIPPGPPAAAPAIAPAAAICSVSAARFPPPPDPIEALP